MEKYIKVERISTRDFGGCNFCSKRKATTVIQILLFQWSSVRTCDECAAEVSATFHNAAQSILNLKEHQ